MRGRLVPVVSRNHLPRAPCLLTGSPFVAARGPQVGDLYDPSTLPDFSGSPCFDLREKKLWQADVRNKDGDLIPPQRYLTDLRPGTVVLAICTLHLFEMPPNGGFKRGRKVTHPTSILRTPYSHCPQIYQLNIVSLRVLEDSGHPKDPIGLVSAPSTSTTRVEDAATSAFEGFSLDNEPPSGPPSSVAPSDASTIRPDDNEDVEIASAADDSDKPPAARDIKGKGRARAPAKGRNKRTRAEVDDDDEGEPMDVEDD